MKRPVHVYTPAVVIGETLDQGAISDLLELYVKGLPFRLVDPDSGFETWFGPHSGAVVSIGPAA